MAQDERTAGKLSKVVTCYQNALYKMRNADPQIALYQPKYDTAVAALQKNIDDTTKAQNDLSNGQKNLPTLKAQLKQLEAQLFELKKQLDPTYVLTLDENTEGSIKYLEKQFNKASSEAHIAQKKLELADKKIRDAETAKSAPINIYTCTKDAQYKGLKGHDEKGYAYKNPVAYDARKESLIQTVNNINNDISVAERKLAGIPKSDRTGQGKQQKVIDDLKVKQKAAQSELDALKSNTTKTLCYDPAVSIVNNDKNIINLKSQKETTNAELQSKLDAVKKAEKALETAKEALAEKLKKEEEEKKKEETKK